ncbi:hypothetical protein ACA910_000648 [Epithemia clementina (nom. ined.)]
MQDLERDSGSDVEVVTSPTSPVTYRPSPYELLRNAKIEINRKYLESIRLEKAASELKNPSQKENKTAGKKSSLGNVEDAEVTPTSKTWPKQKCASTETAMVKKKRMMAKQRHERKKLRATARAAAKEDNNAKLDEKLEKLARELEEPNIGVNRKKELMTLMVDKTVDNAAIKKKLTMEEEESSAIGTTPSSASDELSSSSSSSFRLSRDDDEQEDRKMPAKPSPKLAANKATDTTWVARLERKIMDKLGLTYIPASVKRYDKLRRRKSIESGKKIGPPYRGCVWQILQYHRSICKKVIQKSQKQRNLRTRRTAEEIEVTRRQLEKKNVVHHKNNAANGCE